jgi:hypothetical protein
MHENEITDIFESIDLAIELEKIWQEEKIKKEFIYAVFIWSEKIDLAEWRTFSTKPNSVRFIGQTILSLYPKTICPYNIEINPLGFEDDENNLEKLRFILGIMKLKGVFSNNDDDLTGV